MSDQILDVARGLAYLHTHKPPIIHADLKGVRAFSFRLFSLSLSLSQVKLSADLRPVLEQRAHYGWWSRCPMWFWSLSSRRRSRKTYWIDAVQSRCRSFTLATTWISGRYRWTSHVNIRRLVIWMYRLWGKFSFSLKKNLNQKATTSHLLFFSLAKKKKAPHQSHTLFSSY